MTNIAITIGFICAVIALILAVVLMVINQLPIFTGILIALVALSRIVP